MVVYRKIYFELLINNQCNWLKNNTAQLYILYEREPSYVVNFPVHLRTALIFIDFPRGNESQSCDLLEIFEYHRHPYVNWKNSNVGWISLIQNIKIVKYYFLDIYIGYLFILPKKISHIPPWYNLFDKVELRVRHAPCTCSVFYWELMTPLPLWQHYLSSFAKLAP